MPSVRRRVAALLAIAASACAGDPAHPPGMIQIPGGSMRIGLGPDAALRVAPLLEAERAALRAWLRTHPRLAEAAAAADPAAAIAAERTRQNQRMAKDGADLKAIRSLAEQFPDDQYVRSRTATLEAAVADARTCLALLDQYEARLAFIAAQPSWLVDELGTAEVVVKPFLLDRTEVTVADYQAFCTATGRSMPWPYQAASSGTANLKGHPRSLFPEQTDPSFADPRSPIAGVSHADAVAYATWAGKRLPTEIEWEWAARGGLPDPLHPWGDAPWDGTQANLGSRSLVERSAGNPNHVRIDLPGPEDAHPVLAPVGSYPPNGYGLHDMAGNVMEWCQGEPCYEPALIARLGGAAAVDPAAPRRWGMKAGDFQPLRGSAYTDFPLEARTGRRYGAPAGHNHAERGFRCARSLE